LPFWLAAFPANIEREGLMNRTSVSTIAFAAFVLFTAVPASLAVNLSTYYGDDDGFGVGQFAGTLTDPTTSHDGPGDDPLYVAPGFSPDGSFGPFVVPAGHSIVGASITMRAGSWVNGTSPLDGPNQLFLDGMLVPAPFLQLFTNTADEIETRTAALDASFFPLLADGNVALAGTIVSEESGAGSFQIDFLRLDISTIPEPAGLVLLLIGVLLSGMNFRSRDLKHTSCQ
jgi:hypothetical protein